MKELYAQLGDWYLAMAAYDWGPGNVQRAVQRTGYADFWELYRRNVLPQETKNYVPIIIAAAIMAKNPQQYGLQSLTPDPPLLIDTVTTDYSVDLRLVSDLVEAPVQEIVGPQSQPAADEHAQRRSLRAASARRQQRSLSKTHLGNPRGQAESMAVSQSGCRRIAARPSLTITT